MMNGERDLIGDGQAAAAMGRFALLTRVAVLLVGVGGVLSLLTLWRGEPDRFAFAYLWGFTFIWTVALGGLFFVVLHHLTHAVWSVVVRRVAEMFASLLPVVALLLVPLLGFVVFSNYFGLYPWCDTEWMHHDHILEGKLPYLNVPFFVVRGLVFVGFWALAAHFFVNRSLRQDTGALGEEASQQMRKWSTAFMPLFALTLTFASFDWLMSLEPYWFSTIYGVYIFAGVAASGLAAMTIVVVWLRAAGLLGDDLVRGEHLYSLGALLFTFTCFWAYIAFSQFMLIWYASIPEETVYFLQRTQDGWLEVSIALALVRFVVPFFLLLSRPAKMNPRRLVIVSILILAGQLLDLYWLIMPQLHPSARFGWQELGPPSLLTGIAVLMLVRFLSERRLVAVGDPWFEESCRFHL
jgi:hypothetical protein